MQRADRRRLRAALPALTGWVAGAERVRSARDDVCERVVASRQRLAERTVDIDRVGAPGWLVVPLTRDDLAHARAALAAEAALPAMTGEESRRLADLAGLGPTLAVARRMTGWRRWFTSPRRRAAADSAMRSLLDRHAWGGREHATAALRRWAPREPDNPDQVPVDRLAALVERPGTDPGRAELRAVAAVGELPRAVADLDRGVAHEAPLRERVDRAVLAIREPWVRSRLDEQPVADLGKVSTDRLRLDLLRAAGLDTVGRLRSARRSELTGLQGIGPQTADAIEAAVSALEQIAYDEAPVRLDPDRPTPATTTLLAALIDWDGARVTRGAAEDLRRAATLRPLAEALDDQVTDLLVLPVGQWRAADVEQEVLAVVRRADRVLAALRDAPPADRPVQRPADPWAELARRPADFYAALAEAGVGQEQRVLGDLPAGLVDTVAAQELRTEHLRVTLRTYQLFAARFALVQGRVVIGDEMGLGKTIEALAVLAHLWSTGASRFLVVCPASVVTNWVREVAAKSTIPVHRVHGPDLEPAFDAWRRDGGVAVISFASMGWQETRFQRIEDLDCVVVDEAHFLKNPDAWRTRATLAQVAKSERALLLTGTPMENRVAEFRTLLGYLRPDLVAGSEGLAPWPFRQRVAPAYLRRTVEDVLSELPELVETEEWVELSDADLATYRTAVAEGNFAAMRRAALLHGANSPKVARLVDLVEEAEDNGRRVVVFSYYREVLAALAEHLPAERVGPVFGPLTGSVDPSSRQRIIDDFSAAEHGAVLLAQITTGGVGVNIQAASVVIICEPQLKPTTEAQAIARAHRMGQLRSVQVHRLLGEDSVDERITEILATKQRAFDDYVGASELAAAVPEATDFSDADLTRQVVAAEQERLLYRPPSVVAPDD